MFRAATYACISMKCGRLGGAIAVVGLLATASAAAAFGQSGAGDRTPLFRVFLTDGTSLVSYGETAPIEGRLVFLMPTSASTGSTTPPLQLVTVPSDRVDWPRTNAYAESVRAAHYLSTRAMDDYLRLSSEMAETVNAVALAKDPATRLTLVEAARRKLSAWPGEHYNFNLVEVQQWLAFLDEAIADLRAATGAARFNLDLATTAVPLPPLEPLLPPPTLKEAIEQVLIAAGLADSAVERSSLLATALSQLTSNASLLPADWAVATADVVRAAIAEAVQIEREYQLLSQKSIRMATEYARAADVRAIQQLLTDMRTRDTALGHKRPDIINATEEAVQVQLNEARLLQLARDHWALRVGELRRYNVALSTTFENFSALKPRLEDIRALAGSTPAALATIERLSGVIIKRLANIKIPDQLQSGHALLVTAAQLADTASRIRGEAARTADISRAWDASSAAAGALQLFERARSDIRNSLLMPQLK